LPAARISATQRLTVRVSTDPTGTLPNTGKTWVDSFARYQATVAAVLQRISKTRALDGTQRAEGRNVNVSWTYHPDNGLGMVFEVEH
jgi:hypothetical protein